MKAEVRHDMGALLLAIMAQTEAITALADSNMSLIAAMGDMEPDTDAEPTTYMDGSPCR